QASSGTVKQLIVDAFVMRTLVWRASIALTHAIAAGSDSFCYPLTGKPRRRSAHWARLRLAGRCRASVYRVIEDARAKAEGKTHLMTALMLQPTIPHSLPSGDRMRRLLWANRFESEAARRQ